MTVNMQTHHENKSQLSEHTPYDIRAHLPSHTEAYVWNIKKINDFSHKQHMMYDEQLPLNHNNQVIH